MSDAPSQRQPALPHDVPAAFEASAPHDVRRFLSLLWQGRGVREIRIPKHNQYGQTAAGYFGNVEDAAIAAEAWDGRANVYITLNQVNPALLSRAVNRIDPRASTATSDDDVVEREWLFIDIDAQRPSGISCTAEELAHAQHLLAMLTGFLAAEGWPKPVTCMSGNGSYALYRIALANDPAATALVKQVLESLAERFNTGAAHVDTAVSNAARIIALVGTMKMKGDSTEDRPHRRSYVVSAPERLAVVSRAQLEAVAGAQASKARRPALSVVARSGGRLTDMLDAAGIEYREQSPDANGVTWYHVHECPLHDDGQPFECGVGQTLPDGPYAGHCFHPEGDGKGWQEFKRALGLDGGERGRAMHDRAMVLAKKLQEIFISSRHRREIAADAWDAVLAENDPTRLFRHGRGIAQLARDDDGRLLIDHLSHAGLSGHVDRCANFMKVTEYGIKPARPPRDVIDDMEAMEKPLPLLRGIVGTPVFTADGTLVTDAGYQSLTKLFYEPVGEAVQAVPNTPDATDLRMAKEIIGLDWLGDFPFVGDASRANAIAVPLTVIAREMIHGPTPLFLIDAPSAGTGKGLLAAGAGIVVNGTEPSVMSELRGDEELRKRITAKLAEGPSLLLIDNVKRRIDSGVLAALLTAPSWSDRVLGVSRMTDLPTRAVWMCTGNNIQLNDEIARRSVWIRLDAARDRAWERQNFRHPDLKVWLYRHRHELVWAFLVLVRHWVARNKPVWNGTPLGSFEEWSRVVGGILEAAGIGGFMENREQLYDRSDAESEEWRRFVWGWWDEHHDRAVAVGDVVELAQDLLPTLFAKAKDGASDRALRTRLGKALIEQRDRRFKDYFIRYVGTDKHSKGALWTLEEARDDSELAEPGAGDAASSAHLPQKNDSTPDSFAEDAEDAEDVFESIENKNLTASPSPFARATRDPLPQVPQLPQPDSISDENGAEVLRKMPAEAEQHPRCDGCGRAMSVVRVSTLCMYCKGAK